MKRVEVWRKVHGTDTSVLLCPLWGGVIKGAGHSLSQTVSASGNGQWLPDHVLETPVWGRGVPRMLHEWFLWFGAALISASLYQGWENPRSVGWPRPPFCIHRPTSILQRLASRVVLPVHLPTCQCSGLVEAPRIHSSPIRHALSHLYSPHVPRSPFLGSLLPHPLIWVLGWHVLDWHSWPSHIFKIKKEREREKE